MLHNLKDLRGDRIAARDGEIGRKVLISPVSVDRAEPSEHALAVAVSREQVERSCPAA